MYPYFALADLKGLSASQANGLSIYLKTHKVPMFKKPREIIIEASPWCPAHRRIRRCNYYHIDKTIEALIQETNQKSIISARPIVLEQLGVVA